MGNRLEIRRRNAKSYILTIHFQSVSFYRLHPNGCRATPQWTMPPQTRGLDSRGGHHMPTCFDGNIPSTRTSNPAIRIFSTTLTSTPQTAMIFTVDNAEAIDDVTPGADTSTTVQRPSGAYSSLQTTPTTHRIQQQQPKPPEPMACSCLPKSSNSKPPMGQTHWSHRYNTRSRGRSINAILSVSVSTVDTSELTASSHL